MMGCIFTYLIPVCQLLHIIIVCIHDITISTASLYPVTIDKFVARLTLIYSFYRCYLPHAFIAACPPGTYKNHTGPGDRATCTSCPDTNHASPSGSTSIDQCVCKLGFHSSGHYACEGDTTEARSRRRRSTRHTNYATCNGGG